MNQRTIPFGVIGCGLMGREFASAAARWCHLTGVDFAPQIVAACDRNPATLDWFRAQVPSLQLAVTDYRTLLESPQVEGVYVAVPHDQHQAIYTDVIRAGKHLLAEKPFGIDLAANQAILQAVQENPSSLVRCSSQFPFFPGAYRIFQWLREGRFGRIIGIEAGFWHSSDLDPHKPINWKRKVAINGEYGCMGDLGMHVLHIPLRVGWMPSNVRALLSKIIRERPDKDGTLVPCETWDNAVLACETHTPEQQFPMLLSFKRIAPGHANTWFLCIYGTEWSAEFSTQNPKQLRYLPYTPGGPQEWHTLDVPYQSAYPAITGSIFEFGFSDAILQMWAAFCDELVHGPGGMVQPLRCALPEETALSHRLFTAALESQRTGQTISL
jgi:predicted dehydrogenase